MKGFIYIGDDIYINKDIIIEKKEYKDCIKLLTKYGEIIKIKKENKNEK